MVELGFALALILQLVILAVPLLLLGDWTRFAVPIQVAPTYAILAVNYFAYFVLSQMGYAASDWTHRRRATFASLDGAYLGLESQALLLCFLTALVAGVLIGRLASTRRFFRLPDWRTPTESTLSVFYFIIGAVATLALFSNLDGVRSTLVATPTGKALYALSFFLTSGALVLSMRSLYNGRAWRAALFVFVAAVSLALLGGRGRVLWLVLGAWTGARVIASRPVSIALLAGIGGLLFVALFVLDAAFIVLLTEGGDVRAAVERLATSIPNLVKSPGFDVFDNLVLIRSGSHDVMPELLLGGSREYFMRLHFPTAYLAGIGFPIGLPGELWLIGRTPGVVLGAGMLGVAIGTIDAALGSRPSASALATALAIAPWLSGVGSAYLEHTGKLLAALVPGTVLMVAIVAIHGLQRPNTYDR